MYFISYYLLYGPGNSSIPFALPISLIPALPPPSGPGDGLEGGQGGRDAGPQALPVRSGPHQGGGAAEEPQQTRAGRAHRLVGLLVRPGNQEKVLFIMMRTSVSAVVCPAGYR